MQNSSSDYGHETGYDGAGSVDRRQPHAADPAPTGAPAPGRLDSTQNYCCPPTMTRDDVRRQRWEARAILWRASLLKSVRCCGAQGQVERLADGEVAARRHVSIRRYSNSGNDRVVGVSGLMACGSVWACPRCSAVVAFERAAELARVFERCRSLGGSAYLLTLTLRHHAGDRLEELWDLLTAGWRSAFGSRSWTGASATNRRAARVGDRDRFGVAGLVRVVEVTVSRPGSGSGWHLHIHCVVMCPDDLDVGIVGDCGKRLSSWGLDTEVPIAWLARQCFFARVVERWAAGVRRAGGAAVMSDACDIRAVDLGEDEFLSSYLAKSTYSAALEVTAGQPVKRAVGDRMSPFELLAELVSDGPRFGVRTPRSWSVEQVKDQPAIVDHRTGEITELKSPGLWKLWHTWELNSRGHRQISWSRSRRHDETRLGRFWAQMLRARGEVMADEEVASRGVDGEHVADIPIEVWQGQLVWQPADISALVDAATDGNAKFFEKCRELNIEI